ncbi:MAG: PD-(D/E)XK nuclease family protein [Verrucomicrobia bacterium]|nr:PD-(D/E)XK nuclease family protein [Verrucomicrobiota bacterium]
MNREESRPQRTRFLFGPAGTGKTWRCLEEIHRRLEQSPEGRPLLFLAPRQATYQLERQLLSRGELQGWSRLHILSFERCARFILEDLREPTPPLLEESGRAMVTRALLAELENRLRVFRPGSRGSGLAAEIGALLEECRRRRLSPEQLERLAERTREFPLLQAKLADLGLLARAYAQWLRDRNLSDAETHLDLAAAALRKRVAGTRAGGNAGPFPFEGLWLDGFAQLTPQETELLCALIPLCEESVLAFCAEPEAVAGTRAPDPLSTWSFPAQTARRLWERLEEEGVSCAVEPLVRRAERSRFARAPALARLEAGWEVPPAKPAAPGEQLRLLALDSPEAEAVWTARQILRRVRAGWRFRDMAVILRSLEPYHAAIARAFGAYDIPFFLDRREPVAHHPLAELTRSALRLAAFGWTPEDLFACLKSGLLPITEEEADLFEAEAIARGWRGAEWFGPLLCRGAPALQKKLERIRDRFLPPLERFHRALLGKKGRAGRRPPAASGSGAETLDGARLAKAVFALWKEIRAQKTLARWAEQADAPDPANPPDPLARQIHAAAFEQLAGWLENAALAFADRPAPLEEWPDVVEAGLAELSVGVVPPALDQVLVGAVDRSRNPELKGVFLLGFNEGLFPDCAPAAPLLTEEETRLLADRGAPVGLDLRERLARENYLAYIACTRASERLAILWSRRSAEGNALNPSPFIHNIRRIFPALEIERPELEAEIRSDPAHPNELRPALLRALLNRARPEELPEAAARLFPRPPRPPAPKAPERLDPALCARLYPQSVVETFPTALEIFAACPFRFFVEFVLQGREPSEFAFDPAARGGFLHRAMAEFHRALRQAGQSWAQTAPEEAAVLIDEIAERLRKEFGEGELLRGPHSDLEFEAGRRLLRRLVRVLTAWHGDTYSLEPAVAEWAFGGQHGGAPALEIALPGGGLLRLRGRVDRIDCAPAPSGEALRFAVLDYKSGRTLGLTPALLRHGVQLQLPLYVLAAKALAEHWADGVRAEPIGMFHVPLRPRREKSNQSTELSEEEARARARQKSYRHRGRFDIGALDLLARPPKEGAAEEPVSLQFSYPKKRALQKNYKDPVSAEEFAAILEHSRKLAEEFGKRILEGDIAVSPYSFRGQKACDTCPWAAVCRIDPWTHRFRVLNP